MKINRRKALMISSSFLLFPNLGNKISGKRKLANLGDVIYFDKNVAHIVTSVQSNTVISESLYNHNDKTIKLIFAQKTTFDNNVAYTIDENETGFINCINFADLICSREDLNPRIKGTNFYAKDYIEKVKSKNILERKKMILQYANYENSLYSGISHILFS